MTNSRDFHLKYNIEYIYCGMLGCLYAQAHESRVQQWTSSSLSIEIYENGRRRGVRSEWMRRRYGCFPSAVDDSDWIDPPNICWGYPYDKKKCNFKINVRTASCSEMPANIFFCLHPNDRNAAPTKKKNRVNHTNAARKAIDSICFLSFFSLKSKLNDSNKLELLKQRPAKCLRWRSLFKLFEIDMMVNYMQNKWRVRYGLCGRAWPFTKEGIVLFSFFFFCFYQNDNEEEKKKRFISGSSRYHACAIDWPSWPCNFLIDFGREFIHYYNFSGRRYQASKWLGCSLVSGGDFDWMTLFYNNKWNDSLA